MSINLMMVPVALAMRVLMGKEGFENFVNSQIQRYETPFNDEADLVHILQESGYDAESWSGALKTHVDGENFWVLWEKIDERWTAVFGKQDSADDIESFVRDIEQKSGVRVILLDINAEKLSNELSKVFPTNFRSEKLLKATLRDYGIIEKVDANGSICCNINDIHLRFFRDNENPFSVEVSFETDMKCLYECLGQLNDSYEHTTQADTYQKIITRAIEKGYKIESERVDDDNTVTLTLLT